MLAAAIQICEHGDGPIQITSLKQAILIVEHFQTHQYRTVSIGNNEPMLIAIQIAKSIRKQEIDSDFNVSDIMKMRYEHVSVRKDAEEALTILEEFGWIERHSAKGRYYFKVAQHIYWMKDDELFDSGPDIKIESFSNTARGRAWGLENYKCQRSRSERERAINRSWAVMSLHLKSLGHRLT